MRAYGYEVKGSEAALKDVEETAKLANCRINWGNFKTGDNYYTGNGERYKVTVDHTAKVVTIEEE